MVVNLHVLNGGCSYYSFFSSLHRTNALYVRQQKKPWYQWLLVFPLFHCCQNCNRTLSTSTPVFVQRHRCAFLEVFHNWYEYLYDFCSSWWLFILMSFSFNLFLEFWSKNEADMEEWQISCGFGICQDYYIYKCKTC